MLNAVDLDAAKTSPLARLTQDTLNGLNSLKIGHVPLALMKEAVK
jgi:hypothetical protein